MGFVQRSLGDYLGALVITINDIYLDQGHGSN